MLEKFLNIFRIPDLRKRIGFTLGLLAVYRLGAHIPTPGVDASKLAQFFNQNAGGALGLLDLFNGGNLRKLTEHGILKKRNGLVKVLANGELKTAVTVHAHKFSKAAKSAIEAAGGKAIVIGGETAAEETPAA